MSIKLHLIKTPALFFLQMAMHASQCPVLMEDFAKMESVATPATARLGTRASTVKSVQNHSHSGQSGSLQCPFSSFLPVQEVVCPLCSKVESKV